MTLGIAGLVPHWTMESHVVVHLDDRSAWRDIRSDRPATNADILGCLAALDALLLRGSFYAGPERTFLKNVTLAASHSGTSAAHSSSVNMNAPIQPSGESISRDNLVLQVAAMLEFSCSYPHACLFQLLESQTIAQLRLQLQQSTEAVSKAEVDLFCCCYRRSQYLCRCFFAPPCPILLL